MSSTIPSHTTELSKAGNCVRIGLPWRFQVYWSAITDVTGYSGKCKLMSSNTAGATTLATPTVTLTNAHLNDAVPYNIQLDLTDVVTSGLTATENSYLYLTMTDGSSRDIGVIYGPCPIEYWGAP